MLLGQLYQTFCSRYRQLTNLHSNQLFRNQKTSQVNKVEFNYQKLFQNIGYLFCLSEKGLLTVIELKSQGKEQLISVTTSIDLTEGTTQLEGSKKIRD